MPEPTLRSALTGLLSQIQDGKEVRAYLDRFGAADRTGFAVIKVGGAVLAEELETLAASLSLLHTVGLVPIVVHGAGPQLDAALAEAGADAGKKDGLRVTTPDVLRVVDKVARRVGADLAAAVRAHGGAASPMPPGIVEARLLDADVYGLVGEPERIDLDLITETAASGAIPIIGCVGATASGQLVNVNADAVARALCKAVRPMKIVFVTGVGGLLDSEGSVISSINLDAELETLVERGVVHSGMRLKLEEIGKLLEPLPASSSVSITSPKGLVRELFTHGGQGTLVRRGERVATLTEKSDLDMGRLAGLVETAFSRRLKPGALEALNLRRAYVSDDYRAAALTASFGEAAYLDKFVIDKSARGAGLSHVLWRMLREDEPLLYWRSRADNPFNAFYMERASGLVRADPWVVFWAGPAPFATLDAVVAEIASRPASFEDGGE
ncbi:MAG: acetylglutamate kinase [Pseudomonadota bacterium]